MHRNNDHVNDIGAQQTHQTALQSVRLVQANPFGVVGSAIVVLQKENNILNREMETKRR